MRQWNLSTIDEVQQVGWNPSWTVEIFAMRRLYGRGGACSSRIASLREGGVERKIDGRSPACSRGAYTLYWGRGFCRVLPQSASQTAFSPAGSVTSGSDSPPDCHSIPSVSLCYLQQLRQLLSNLCYLERESKDNKTIKIADFTITKEIAMKYMKKRHPGYHMRPSRWKDIRVSVHI